MARLPLLMLFYAAGAMLVSAAPAFSQTFPSKPLRIVTVEAGGGQDFSARLIAQGLTIGLGQQVIVENRPAGVIPGDIVARAQPDGYTLLLAGTSLWTAPFLQKNVPYDPVRDFSPVTLMARSPGVLVLHPSVQVNSIKELIALAKARPGQLNYATAGAGSPNHIAAELFNSLAGVDIVRIPYKGQGPALIDLIAGQVQMTFGTAASVTPHVRAGKLRALAVTTSSRSTVFPGVPAVAETLPGYESASIFVVFAPARTPAAIIDRLNRESVRFLKTDETKARLLTNGVEAIGSTASECAAAIKADMTRVGKLIKDAGIRLEG